MEFSIGVCSKVCTPGYLVSTLFALGIPGCYPGRYPDVLRAYTLLSTPLECSGVGSDVGNFLCVSGGVLPVKFEEIYFAT